MKSEKIYGWVKTAGGLAIIPIILVSGPLGGYLIGDLLVRKFHLPGYLTVVFIILGFIASIRETVKIIRLALKAKL